MSIAAVSDAIVSFVLLGFNVLLLLPVVGDCSMLKILKPLRFAVVLVFLRLLLLGGRVSLLVAIASGLG